MNQPTITDVRLRSKIPVDARFIGWVIHNPLQDDFLQSYRENEFSLHKTWVIYPDMAKRFKKWNKAARLIEELELKDKAHVVAAFDCHPGIRIGN